MIEVVVRHAGDLERALKTLRDRIGKEGLMVELKDREYHLTRSERRKLKDRRAAARRKKRERYVERVSQR